MSAADRFIDGQDRLAALLKALPAYVPPERLAAAVQAAAHAAQQEADARRAGALPLAPQFAAPPGLASAVLEAAARLQAAQAGRRDAVLAGIAAGQPAAQALGAPVSDATRDWLAAQTRSTAIAQATVRTEQIRTTRARRWWRSLGAVASVAAVAGLTTSIVLRQVDEGALQPGAVRESATPAAVPATAPAPTAAPAARDDPGRAQDAPVATPANPTPPAPKAAPSASRELRQAREAAPRQRVQPSAERKTTPRGETQAMPAPATEGLLPQAPAVAAAPPMPAYSAMAEAAPAPSAPSAPAPAAAPQADAARKAAPPLAAARAPAALAAAAMVVSVQEDPAAIAARMQAATPLGVWAAEPDSAEIREWVQRLWPVSYTHLDVYKRQGLGLPCASRKYTAISGELA
ncbi:hypothetical protein, partial [Cupriavidus oxalaticus]|uniref:hypothetical protein n=1 Tax=Cupriavidus oxalaticus TaxID=96344 RepID=UPI000E2FACED